ncbi:MAG: hypothetical protein HF982_06525 [Desulfobacteraceae bacterium]|nr:hypothetical protein [Desulfobacteraceae bacterium]MBC2719229.1 hypothetical protein [Desulfobacteraceae bacterium]
MNIVVDTNVLISAVLWKGVPSDALKIILEKWDLKVETIIETLITQSRLYNRVVAQ